MLQRGFPYRRRLQRDLSSKQVRSIPRMFKIWSTGFANWKVNNRNHSTKSKSK